MKLREIRARRKWKKYLELGSGTSSFLYDSGSLNI